ncbi:protein translocase subunit SecD [Clostridium hydrogeniformans]|uniref:protein translocase subunit SecD n=1 Tax=Clostridium hydrogeniformans TaxID=349933 RepID=UPI000554B5A2|nr:protein translocase subunit SecD [Clostridium hydrogeniformans]
MQRGRNMKTKGKGKGRSWVVFILIAMLVGFFAYSGAYGVKLFGNTYEVKSFGSMITKGLDLQGGVSVIEEIVSEDGKVKKEDLEKTKELLSLRVNRIGVAETTVTTEGENRIRVDIPGKFESKDIIDTLTKTGELTFKAPDGTVLLTGKEVENAGSRIDQNGKAIIDLEFNEDGKEKFKAATEKYIGQQISIYMDDEVLTSPMVKNVINDGKAIIEGSKSIDEAKRQAGVIQSGALPVTLKTVSVKTVGPTLGSSAIPSSLKAGAIGIGLIFLFMIVFYRVPGLLADFALVIYILLLLTIFSSLKVVLTLPGIAGFLLTIGMAVDANVLIFERIKEEIKTGKSIKSSIDSGFHRALSSILDSNITTIIGGLVLYFFGSGAVKGFAITLMIGIVVSMFTAITVTRVLIKLAVNMGILNKPSLFGVRKRG